MSIDTSIALVTMEEYRIFAKAEQSADAELIEMIINGVSDLMQRRMGRRLIYTEDIEEDIHGNSKPYIDVKRWPIVAINSITEDTESLTVSTDYKVNNELGRIYRVSGLYGREALWAKGVYNITVDYDAGFSIGAPGGNESRLPYDITEACLKQIAHEVKRSRAKDWGESSRTFPDGSVTKNVENLLPSVERVCKLYKRYRV